MKKDEKKITENAKEKRVWKKEIYASISEYAY
jgi:hypothetical protein